MQNLEGPVVVYAPQGRDAEVAARVLCDAGIFAQPAENLTHAHLNETCGTLLLSEQSLQDSVCQLILDASRNQTIWSDLPIVILSNERVMSSRNMYLESLYNACNVTIIQKPVPMISLITTIRSALRARHRQRQVADLLSAQQVEVQERDEFMSMLSHELRNPLGPILNCMHIIQNDACPPVLLQRARGSLQRQILQLARMLDDLLDVARISRGRITLNKSCLDFVRLVKNSIDDHRSVFDEKKISLNLRLPSKPVFVNGDATRLTQVIGNLLSNAVKFTDDGGRITVDVHNKNEEGRVVLIVWDNGVGMNREMLKRLFKPFNQADKSLDRGKGGLGLGLVIAKRLMDMHDGSIEAASEGLGKGSQFVLKLPISLGEVMPCDTAHPNHHGNKKVLIIEDNCDAAETLQILLQMEGHNVDVAYSGIEGIKMAQASEPDIIFCDIGLPGVDGYQVARELAPLRHKIVKLVALTGYGSTSDQKLAKDAGFDLHLTKPVDPNVLNSILVNI